MLTVYGQLVVFRVKDVRNNLFRKDYEGWDDIDEDVPLTCLKIELESDDLIWKDGDLLGEFGDNFEKLSAPPKDWRREAPLLMPMGVELRERERELGDLKVSSSTLSRNWNFSC